MRADPRAEAMFGIAPDKPKASIAPHKRPFAPPAARTLGDDEIMIGASELVGGGPVGLSLPKLMAGRLMIQGASGAGKSWTLRRLLEQSAAKVQQIVIDPERGFNGLAERYGHVWVDGAKLDYAAFGELARRVREHRISIVLDLFDCPREEQMIAVAAFLEALIAAPREQWHSAIVAIDEAHRLAPHGDHTGEKPHVRKAAIGAIVDLMSRGRKRGLCGVLATVRLARLSKSATSDIVNYLVGQNTLDRDISRAAETIGWNARRASDRLPTMRPGDFVSVGPAFSANVVLRVGAVETFHADATPVVVAPPVVDAARASKLLDVAALAEQAARAAEITGDNAPPPGLRAVRNFLRDPAFAAAAKIFGALKLLAPDGALVAELTTKLVIFPRERDAALDLLNRHGVLEFSGEGDRRAVRLERGIREGIGP